MYFWLFYSRLHLNWVCHYHILLAIPHTSPVRLACYLHFTGEGRERWSNSLDLRWCKATEEGDFGAQVLLPAPCPQGCFNGLAAGTATTNLAFSTEHFENVLMTLFPEEKIRVRAAVLLPNCLVLELPALSGDSCLYFQLRCWPLKSHPFPATSWCSPPT